MDNAIRIIQEYYPLVAILAAAATVLGVAFAIYRASHDKHVQSLKERIRSLEADLEHYKVVDIETLKLTNEQLRGQLEEKVGECQVLQVERDALQKNLQNAQEVKAGLSSELENAKQELNDVHRADRSRANLLKRALKLEGKVWLRKVLQGVPRFLSIHDRRSAIISVLSLKGGVGKTTVTAQLAAALSAKGYRVLLMDLDLQGSLSSLFIHESTLADLSREKRLLQHFLLSGPEQSRPKLLDFCVPVLDGKSAIVPTTDGMAYAELNLTMRWLLRIGKKDTRFLLRRGLHQKRISRRFDIVLLDCPPLFNTCCVNALAASDFVLIPVVPSQKAAERVPLLLERLKTLCRVINSELQVAGILFNRTRGNQLTEWETDLWNGMLVRCQDQWTGGVHAFNTFIRQTTEVRDSEIVHEGFSPPGPGSDLHSMFARLLAELEERLPRDCRRADATLFGPG